MVDYVADNYLKMLEHEQNERLELEKERVKHSELESRYKKLEEENAALSERFKVNQIEIITRKNDLNNLLELLQKEKRDNLEAAQRLQISKEQIESINSFLSDLRPIKEQLSFKKSVEECLHNMLIKTKLSVAEGEDLLQELHDQLTELEYEVEKTRDFQRKSVSQWQEEFLSARLREADLVLEFDKIKRAISSIKHALEEKILIQKLIGVEDDTNKSSSFFKKNDPKIEQIKSEEEISINNTVRLQNEIDHLKSQIKHLEDQKDDCIKRVFFNDEIKVNTQEVKRSIWSREHETSKQIDKVKEDYRKLNEKMSKQLEDIQNSLDEKDRTISELGNRIEALQNTNHIPLEDNEEKDQAEEINKLLKQQSFLEEIIEKHKTADQESI